LQHHGTPRTASCAEEIATIQGKDTMGRWTVRSTEIMVNIQWGGLQVTHREDEERSSCVCEGSAGGVERTGVGTN